MLFEVIIFNVYRTSSYFKKSLGNCLFIIIYIFGNKIQKFLSLLIKIKLMNTFIYFYLRNYFLSIKNLKK